MNRKIYLLILQTLVVYYKTYGQSYDFNVYIGNQKTGSMNISITNYSKGNELIDIKMDFKSVSISENRIQYFGSAYFKKSILTDSESLLENNKILKEKCNVKWIKTNYKVQRKDENPDYLEDKIGFIFEQLYLKEPTNVSSVFSIRHGIFLDLKMIKSGVYSIKLPISGTTYFYYQNGRFLKSETSGNIQQMILTPRQK